VLLYLALEAGEASFTVLDGDVLEMGCQRVKHMAMFTNYKEMMQQKSQDTIAAQAFEMLVDTCRSDNLFNTRIPREERLLWADKHLTDYIGSLPFFVDFMGIKGRLHRMMGL